MNGYLIKAEAFGTISVYSKNSTFQTFAIYLNP